MFQLLNPGSLLSKRTGNHDKNYNYYSRDENRSQKPTTAKFKAISNVHIYIAIINAIIIQRPISIAKIISVNLQYKDQLKEINFLLGSFLRKSFNFGFHIFFLLKFIDRRPLVCLCLKTLLEGHLERLELIILTGFEFMFLGVAFRTKSFNV